MKFHKRPIAPRGHRTSFSAEDDFLDGVRDIAAERRQALSHMISTLDAEKHFVSNSSRSRPFVLGFYQQRVAPALTTPINSTQRDRSGAE